jgi:hypothetical protein
MYSNSPFAALLLAATACVGSCQSYSGGMTALCESANTCTACERGDVEAMILHGVRGISNADALDFAGSVIKQDDKSRVMMLKSASKDAGLDTCALADAIEDNRPKVGALGAVTRELSYIDGYMLLAHESLTWGDDSYDTNGLTVLRATAHGDHVWALAQKDIVSDWWVTRSGRSVQKVSVKVKPSEVHADSMGVVAVGVDHRGKLVQGWVMQLDPKGDTAWEVNPGPGVLLDAVLTADAVVVAGTQKNALWLLSLDRVTGATQWEKTIEVGQGWSRPGELWDDRGTFVVVGEAAKPKQAGKIYRITLSSSGDVLEDKLFDSEWGRIQAATHMRGVTWLVGRDVAQGGNDREGPFVGAVGRLDEAGVVWRRAPGCLPARLITNDGTELWMGGEAHGSTLAGWYTPFTQEAFERWRPICSQRLNP